MADDTQVNRRHIQVTCPHCEHSQNEPSMVISTVCRGCGQYISITDEKAVIRPKYATRLATLDSPPVQHPTVAPEIPKPEVKVGFFDRLFKRFSDKPTIKRKLHCYHCSHIFDVVSDAQSTQCAKCGSYISLKDYSIDQAWHRRIQTRGNVTVLKGASITGVNVQCHDLLVLGELSASVECSGKLTIRSHGKIVGNVHCDELCVERGAKVEFQGEVKARTAYIDGEVKGNITCKEKIILEKKARLQGHARASGLVMREGAKHSGLMEVVQSTTEEVPAPVEE
ncbi:MAG: polymer-forming cytoskeletal protein [Verrucomicrobiota bacterium]